MDLTQWRIAEIVSLSTNRLRRDQVTAMASACGRASTSSNFSIVRANYNVLALVPDKFECIG